jgi:hypothetical protein
MVQEMEILPEVPALESRSGGQPRLSSWLERQASEYTSILVPLELVFW